MYSNRHTYFLLLILIFCFSSTYSQILTDPLERVVRLIQLNEYETALKALNEIEGANSEYFKGYISFYLSDPEKAVKHFQAAIKGQTNYPQVHLYLGHALSMITEQQKAIEQYLQYAKTDPSMGNHFAAVRSGQKLLPAKSAFDSKISPLSSSEHDVAAFRNHQGALILLSFRSDLRRNNQTGNSGSESEAFVVTNPNTSGANNLKFYHPDLNRQTYAGPFFYLPAHNEVVFSKMDFTNNLRPSATTITSMQLMNASSTDGKIYERERSFSFTSDGNNGFPTVNQTGDMIIFASDHPGGYGGFDLYKVYRTANGWSAAINLGPEINTPGDEIYPWLDGNILYFSSDWHPGFGGFDIFESGLQKDRWTKPVNLGAGVNSPADELAFSYRAAGNEGFYTSNKKSNRKGYNIYQVNLSTSSFELLVVDQQSGRPVSGAIIREANVSEPVFISTKDGKIKIEGQAIGQKTWRLEASNYQAASIQLNNPGETISLRPVARTLVNGVLRDQHNAGVADALVEWERVGNNERGRTFTNRDGSFNIDLASMGTLNVSITRRGYVNTTLQVLPQQEKLLTLTVQKEEATLVLRGASEVSSAYTIRLGAFRNPDLQKIIELESLGEPVAEQRGDLVLISLAGYQNRQAAESALISVKQQGYPEAYIQSSGTATAPIETKASHRIQIGVFSNPGNADISRLPGNLKVHLIDRAGGTTAMQVGDFKSAAEANEQLQSVHSAGFPEAFVVEIKN